MPPVTPITMAKIIRDWLTEYKSLSEADTKKYASSILSNHNLINSLYNLFHSDIDSSLVVDPVVHQLFEFYRSPYVELRRFTLQYVPTLLTIYLQACSRNEKKLVNSIETTLLGIYNLEVVNEDGSPQTETYRIPSLGMASIYHEATGFMLGATLTQSTLSSFDSDLRKIQYGPFPQVERVNAKNRMSVMTYVLKCYNADIANYPHMSLESVCELASRLCTTGFDNLKSSPSKSKNGRPTARVSLSSEFMVELLNCIYFVMFNGYSKIGVEALQDVHFRASHELYSDVMLVTNAIKNSLSQTTSGQPIDGPMGIRISSSSSHVHSSPLNSKTAITNASFRIKKLPDDITIDKEDGSSDEVLEKKSEEKSKAIEQITRPLKSVLKMSDKLRKDKDKDKDKDKEAKEKDKDSRRDSKDSTPVSSPRKHLATSETDAAAVIASSSKTSKVSETIELRKITEEIETVEVQNSVSNGSRDSDAMFTCSDSSVPGVGVKSRKRISLEKINPHSVNTEV